MWTSPRYRAHGCMATDRTYRAPSAVGSPGMLGTTSPRRPAGQQVTYQNGSATCETWDACDQGIQATFCTIEGQGHEWPGACFGAVSASRQGRCTAPSLTWLLCGLQRPCGHRDRMLRRLHRRHPGHQRHTRNVELFPPRGRFLSLPVVAVNGFSPRAGFFVFNVAPRARAYRFTFFLKGAKDSCG